MQCAWITSRHCWRLVGVWAVDINYHKSSKTCHHTQIDSFVTSWGMLAVERSYPGPLAGRLFYRLCLLSLCYPVRDANGASRDYGAVHQTSMQPSASVDTLYSLHHRIRTIVTTEDSHMPYQRNYCYFCHLLLIPPHHHQHQHQHQHQHHHHHHHQILTLIISFNR